MAFCLLLFVGLFGKLGMRRCFKVFAGKIVSRSSAEPFVC